MPTPSTVQAITSPAMLWAAARIIKPAAMTRFEAARTLRPPCASMSRPTDGPTMADSNNAPENNPKNTLLGSCSAAAIGAPRIAGM
jgi:hypothetical protein